MKAHWRGWLGPVLAAAAFVALTSAQAWGYIVPWAVPLEKLADEADVIVKARVVSLKPAKDAWFKDIPGYGVTAAELKVISTLQGAPVPEMIRFLHYSKSPPSHKRPRVVSLYTPQNYTLAVGRTYLIFADRAGQPWVFRQIWQSHTTKTDQGVFLASSALPVDPSLSLKEIVWKELTGHLVAADPKAVIYDIRQLGDMSDAAPRWGAGLHDFDLAAVDDQLAPLVHHPNREVAMASIWTLGGASPWLDDWRLTFYLDSLSNGNLPGLGPVNTKAANPGAARHWRELADRAGSAGTPLEIRALAIRALGHCGVAEVSGHVERWLEDPQAEARGAATLLLADNPGPPNARLLARSADDPTTTVRRMAAIAIGCGQFDGLLDRLERLLADDSPAVRTAAAKSLLSFPIEASRELLTRHADDPEFQSVFVNALARENPEPWLDRVAGVIEQNLEPRDIWGGQFPSVTSWKILYGYLTKQPDEALQSGRYDRLLDALESPRYWSFSEPRSLYALYLVKGLPDRAKAFRAHCEQTFSYDIGYYFNMADENPKAYVSVR